MSSTKTVIDLPRAVSHIETEWIEMSDGARLAASLWLPEGAERDPVPAVLEYHPYRRRDLSRDRDHRNMSYLAGHGYACVRVDLRGSGDSDGVLEDEYLKRELNDGLEVLRWIASQSWCDGSVGIMGISWSGFNALQIAALNPPELKAVVSLCSTDDRYADDVHFMGGCLLGDNLSWASVMFAYNSLPPDPAVVGARWRSMWLERLEGSGLWLEKWMRHQRRDEYWRHGSICEDFAAVRVPVLLASGWANGYSNAIFRMLAGLEGPRWGLIGPWSHTYPHVGIPGPAIGFLQELLRWWDRWLKNIPSGVEEEPMLRVWMQDSVPPHPMYAHRPGRWVAESEWPSRNVELADFRLAAARLLQPHEPTSPDTLSVRSPLSVGLFSGKWCSYAAPPDLPHDQREEDGGALVFDTAPLPAALEILGAPGLELELSVDQPVAMVAARLSDVAPDGEATRISYGLLNLTHRDGHASPRPLVPHKRYRVHLRLNDVAQNFPPHHRIRLALSSSYFPLAWAPPGKVMLTVYTEGSRMTLPIRKPRHSDSALRSFEEPQAAAGVDMTTLHAGTSEWMVTRDLARDETTLAVVKDDGCFQIDDIELTIGGITREWYGYRRGDLDSVKGEVVTTSTLQRHDWGIRTETRTVLTSDTHSFRIYATLDALESDRRVFSRTWDRTIKRDGV